MYKMHIKKFRQFRRNSSGIINFGTHQINLHFLNSFLLFSIYRAEKRAAWRQARLKSLEQDAIQAQIMIQSLNTDTSTEGGMKLKKKPRDMLDGVEEEEVSRVMEKFFLQKMKK